MTNTNDLINEYLDHESALMREEMTIKTLEREIRGRKIKLARLRRVVNKQKTNLGVVLNNSQRKEVVQQVINRGRIMARIVADDMELRTKSGDGSWLLEPIQPVNVLFDCGRYDKPNVGK